jgi:hypothetical protein
MLVGQSIQDLAVNARLLVKATKDVAVNARFDVKSTHDFAVNSRFDVKATKISARRWVVFVDVKATVP